MSIAEIPPSSWAYGDGYSFLERFQYGNGVFVVTVKTVKTQNSNSLDFDAAQQTRYINSPDFEVAQRNLSSSLDKIEKDFKLFFECYQYACFLDCISIPSFIVFRFSCILFGSSWAVSGFFFDRLSLRNSFFVRGMPAFPGYFLAFLRLS